MKDLNKKISFWVAIFILIIILIIILYFFLGRFGKIGLTPTGNVDIFNIECTKDDKVCPGQPAFGETGFEVISEEKLWNSTNDLRIFSNPAYEFKNIIAPGSSNTYNFVVKNSVENGIKYSLKFLEDNKHDVPMVFKLKKNGKYILGSDKKWLDIHEFETNKNELGKGGSDSYSLEWKWQDSKKDTKIGMIEAVYSLKITIQAS